MACAGCERRREWLRQQRDKMIALTLLFGNRSIKKIQLASDEKSAHVTKAGNEPDQTVKE